MINRSFIARISQKKLADREVVEMNRFVNYYKKRVQYRRIGLKN